MINIFQMECFSSVKCAMGLYVKNMSFLMIPKSPKLEKKVEKIGLGSFNCQHWVSSIYLLKWHTSIMFWHVMSIDTIKIPQVVHTHVGDCWLIEEDALDLLNVFVFLITPRDIVRGVFHFLPCPQHSRKNANSVILTKKFLPLSRGGFLKGKLHHPWPKICMFDALSHNYQHLVSNNVCIL